MKEKILNYTVETDVTDINCDLQNATVIIAEAADGIFRVEYPHCDDISIGNGENSIFIVQRKRGLFFQAAKKIVISVPAHTVPSVKINGKNCALEIAEGIYGQLCINADGANINLCDCALESAEISGGEVNARVYGATVKGTLLVQAERGNLLIENAFAKRAECRIKRGNIGLVNLNCKDCAFDTRKGNINAAITGAEEKFNTTIVTREGTANRASAKRDGADGAFQAYADRGNIMLEFIEEKENA